MMNKKKLKVGDIIYYECGDIFQVDRVKEIIEIDGQILVTPYDYDWLALTEDDLLDESDHRVKEHVSMHTEKMIKLSDARRWLMYHLRRYYEADSWSSFDDERAVKDFCVAMNS